MDFLKIKEKIDTKNGTISVFPSYKVIRSKDLMVRSGDFYAIWDQEQNLWSTDIYRAAELIDAELKEYANNMKTKLDIKVQYLDNFENRRWVDFLYYIEKTPNNYHLLDNEVTFKNTDVQKEDYISKKLPYNFEKGSHESYDKLMNTIYAEEEKQKLEWAIGSIISGDSKYIQKFIVLYGKSGTGKSTIIDIITKLFDGYYTAFEAKALGSNNNIFATDVFRGNPLVAIQHDGDLSRIEDNTKLNSIVSHEEMTLNRKNKESVMQRINAFLFMGTNKPVKITDAKSGIIRRLIDVQPTGNLVPIKEYFVLKNRIDFELGAIAYHCYEVYQELGKNYYEKYVPTEMIYKTDFFFNFVESNFTTFYEQDGVALTAAYDLYKEYCEDSNLKYRMPRYEFREELRNYFDDFSSRTRIDGKQVRNWYSGFKKDIFTEPELGDTSEPIRMTLDFEESLFDEFAKDYPAQYAGENDIPVSKWDDVTTKLKDIDTSKVHYVMLPENHIVIDFDIKDENGKKDYEKNLEEASKWPPTYAEVSKSGKGIHLHYIYDGGDPNELSSVYSENVEIKVFKGKSSLRRKLTKCNNIPIATLSSGLPVKGGDKVVNKDVVTTEKGMRATIKKCLRKEIHDYTKPNVDMIFKVLEDAYNSSVVYDLTDMRPDILAFAASSTNQSKYCLELVNKMHFKSDTENNFSPGNYPGTELVFFDVEVYPNLFVVCTENESGAKIQMINPEPYEMEKLMEEKLVGFNNRRYDNHIIYARMLGYTNQELYTLSQRIVNSSGNNNCFFREAYNVSYVDVYDYSKKKQSLKKWELELGLPHVEMDIPWDQEVPEDQWQKVADYCTNDVSATKKVHEHLAGDFAARVILSELSGCPVNSTTNTHTQHIIFGNETNTQPYMEYTDLSEMFPGYEFDHGESHYRGEIVGEGGYVYAEPGMYSNVICLDIWSMHPWSAINMNIFGKYTKRFKELVLARSYVKHHDKEKASKVLDGLLKPYLDSDDLMDQLSAALKIAINSVYGLTSASFDNPFRDVRNKDNIVAKRGALFMIDLKNAVQERGYTVAHIKTDSIKIVNWDDNIVEFCKEFAEKYGYKFEVEAIYEKICLVNQAVYIAKTTDGYWEATGAQFKEPYVYKFLFSKDPIKFEDMCEIKNVKNADIYLVMDEEDPPKEIFVGETGMFTPIKKGHGGGSLIRVGRDGRSGSLSGAKGYKWLESHVAKNISEDSIDKDYYKKQVDEAIDTINKFGDSGWFLDDPKN